MISPEGLFKNSLIRKRYGTFICDTVYAKIKPGAIRVIGKVGECSWPYIVKPLTFEPSKPRLCHDDRFSNLWVNDSPFHLETLKNVHRLVNEGACMVTTDEKSGYDHVRLSVESQRYFGIKFGDYVMVYTVLPFGFKASPYTYQTIGMVMTSYLRTLSVLTVQYLENRLGLSGVKGDAEAERDGFKVAYVL